eukprot:1160706-Pelagomonas_calceolata.AAC.2
MARAFLGKSIGCVTKTVSSSKQIWGPRGLSLPLSTTGETTHKLPHLTSVGAWAHDMASLYLIVSLFSPSSDSCVIRDPIRSSKI